MRLRSDRDRDYDDVGEVLASVANKINRLKDSLLTARDHADKFKAVAGHFEHESRQLDDDEQHQFAAIFDEFKGVLAEFEEQATEDSRIGDLANFTRSLLDSVLMYLDKKKDLERVSRVETDDFLKRLAKTQKAANDLAVVTLKEVEELKPLIDARIAKALEFTSMMEREETSTSSYPRVPSFNFGTKPNSTIQNLVNLKRTLNSPRESQTRDRDRSRDETTRSCKSREPQTDTVELQLTIEHLRNQITVLQSEVEKRDSRVYSPGMVSDQTKVFELKSKALELRIAGLSKLVDDRVAVTETRVSVAESLLEQLSTSARRLGAKEAKQNKAGETLLSALQQKLETLENENMNLRLESQTLAMTNKGLEKELEFSKLSLDKLKATVEQSFLTTNANKSAELESNFFKLKLENSALLEERAKLEERLKAVNVEKLKVETNLDEIRGNYEQEVTKLKIELKNASLRVSKSRFCSKTNMNLEQTDPTQQPSGSKSKSQFPSGNESIPKPNNKVALERQDSFAKQSWSDIKDMLHAKEEAKSIRLNSVRSQSVSQQSKKPSSSSSGSENDLEHDLGSESSSQEKKKAPVNTSIIKKKSIRLSESVARPGANVRSAQNLPGHIRSTTTSPTRFVHQSMDEYRDRFEKANMTIDTLKCEITTLETRLKKKDEHIGEMKKELAMSKAQMTTKQAEKEALRGELVAVQQKLIVAQCDLDEVRKDKNNTDSEEIPKLKHEIEKLREQVKVFYNLLGIRG